MIALMTALPSSLLPARVVWNASIACSKLKRCVTSGLRSTLPCATSAMARE